MIYYRALFSSGVEILHVFHGREIKRRLGRSRTHGKWENSSAPESLHFGCTLFTYLAISSAVANHTRL